MKIDSESQAIEIVYAALLETMGKLLREQSVRVLYDTEPECFEHAHDQLAEAIEELMGLALRGGAASARMKRIVRAGCFNNSHPRTALWLLHESIAREDLTQRLLDEIDHAGDDGAWDCVSLRNVTKARSILRHFSQERKAHEMRLIGGRLKGDKPIRAQADKNAHRVHDIGRQAYAG